MRGSLRGGFPLHPLVVFDSTLFQYGLDFLTLQMHIVGTDVTAADRAHVVCLEPVSDAIGMECMAHVAS